MRVIRIEEKKFFYTEDISVYLNNVDNIKRSYDKSFIFKSINIGYQKWSAESASGIDDPQTKKTYATLFKQIGENATVLSKFFAAGLGIEQTRRNRVEQTKDWRLDDDTMIIRLDVSDSPSAYFPEFDENFTGITNLNNSGSRYNLRITPAWNFLRWINYFRGCLQSYMDSSFVFTSGEGNYDFQGTMDGSSDCILFTDTEIAENMDIPVNVGLAANDFLHKPDMLDFAFKLSWADYKTIRDNRRKAIGVSKTDEDHDTCHINSLEWKPFDSMADFKVWIGGRTEVTRPNNYRIQIADEFAAQTFNYIFTQIASFSGAISTGEPEESQEVSYQISVVTINIAKTSNSGLASGNGTIQSYVNDSLANTFAFVTSDDISDVDIILTGIVAGDEILVVITEMAEPGPCDGCEPYGPVSPIQTTNCRNIDGLDYYDQLYHDGCCGEQWVTIQGACP